MVSKYKKKKEKKEKERKKDRKKRIGKKEKNIYQIKLCFYAENGM
jgi:hypothetical protein